MRELRASRVLTLTVLVAALALLTAPMLQGTSHQLRCTVKQALPQDQCAPILRVGVAEIAISAVVELPLTVVARRATARPEPTYLGPDHTVSLFIRPPPGR